MIVFAANVLRPGTTQGLPDPDVIVGSTVHLFAAWAAARLARRHRVPFVFEIRDIWPETLVDLGAIKANGVFDRLVARLSHVLIRDAAMVISPLPLVDRYLVDSGFRGKPFTWISNGIDADRSDEAKHTQAPAVHSGGPFVFMYLGSCGFGNGLETLIQAFVMAASTSDVAMELHIVGDGPLKGSLVKLAGESAGGEGIRFFDRIPRSEAIARAKSADCLVAPLSDMRVLQYGIGPNKHFDYMLAARPIIANSPYRGTLPDEARAGIVIPPGDPEKLATAMVNMTRIPSEERQAMGERARDLVLHGYTYEVLANRLAEALNEVLSQPHDAKRGA